MVVANRFIAQALIARGLMPKGCRLIEVSIGVDGGAIVRYEKFVDADELLQVSEALRDAAVRELDQQPKPPRPKFDITVFGKQDIDAVGPPIDGVYGKTSGEWK